MSYHMYHLSCHVSIVYHVSYYYDISIWIWLSMSISISIERVRRWCIFQIWRWGMGRGKSSRSRPEYFWGPGTCRAAAAFWNWYIYIQYHIPYITYHPYIQVLNLLVSKLSVFVVFWAVSHPSGSNPRGKSITFHTLNLSSQKIIEKDGTGEGWWLVNSPFTQKTSCSTTSWGMLTGVSPLNGALWARYAVPTRF